MLLLALKVSWRGPTTPHVHCYTCGLGSSPFARHYWGNHCLFSLPRGTKMFQFPRFASLHISTDDRPSDGRVVPFGNPRIKGHLHLRAAYRSLSRPSSPPGAKASTRRPNSFFAFVNRQHPQGRCRIAHTFSCILEISSIYSVLTKKCLHLQSCVSICQRSLPARKSGSVWRITDSNR